MPSLIESDGCNALEQSNSTTVLTKTSLIFLLAIIAIGLRLVFIIHSDLLVEEAYYWNYANHLAMGYLDHPPMVALLIKLTTLFFGTNESAVRISALICWLVTTWFAFKWSNFINKHSGVYAILLLSIFPFFFLQFMVITPDDPLIVCWSATLYCLFRALVKQDSNYWYFAGIWMGLGLLSKYSIVLLGLATLLYTLIVPQQRFWFKRKEPYLGALIALICFLPVIYWNATHAWASFAFQSTRRFNAVDDFSLYQYFGLILLFLTPIGLFNLWTLIRPYSTKNISSVDYQTQRFFQIFTLVPLMVFGLFSLKHQIKFNWIGPGLLAIIPWIATSMSEPRFKKRYFIGWTTTAILLLFGYSCLIYIGTQGAPHDIYQAFLTKYINWNDLAYQINQVATQIEHTTQQAPVIIPLDSYNIGSELNFYQQKQLEMGKIKNIYPIIGRHVFGEQSLMYQYWDNNLNLSGQMIVLVSKEPNAFISNAIKKQTIQRSSIQKIWATSPAEGRPTTPYYYQVVRMKTRV